MSACLIVCVWLVAAAPADAQTATTGFHLNRFEPAERGSEWFTADSLDLRGHLRPAVGALLDYAYRPLVVYNDDGGTRSVLVRHQLMLHAGVSLILFQRWRVGIDLPVALYQQGDIGYAAGLRYNPPTKAAIGDLRFGTDVRLFGNSGDPFQIALGALFWVPTGQASLYTGDGTVRVMPRATISGDVAWFAYSASLGFHFRPQTQSFAVTPLGSELVLRAALGAHMLGRRLMIGPEVSAATTTVARVFSQRTATNIEVLLGAHWRFAPDWRTGLAVGPGLSRGLGTPEIRFVFSIEFVPHKREMIVTEEGQVRERSSAPVTVGDSDSDGIADAQDACPDKEGIATRDPRTNGCPDADGDGFFDHVDTCPFVFGVAQGNGRNGCPSDRDNDGIVDSQDACPSESGPASSDLRVSGCPDRDGDGVIDRLDPCPALAGSHFSDPSYNGCRENK